MQAFKSQIQEVGGPDVFFQKLLEAIQNHSQGHHTLCVESLAKLKVISQSDSFLLDRVSAVCQEALISGEEVNALMPSVNVPTIYMTPEGYFNHIINGSPETKLLNTGCVTQEQFLALTDHLPHLIDFQVFCRTGISEEQLVQLPSTLQRCHTSACMLKADAFQDLSELTDLSLKHFSGVPMLPLLPEQLERLSIESEFQEDLVDVTAISTLHSLKQLCLRFINFKKEPDRIITLPSDAFPLSLEHLQWTFINVQAS